MKLTTNLKKKVKLGFLEIEVPFKNVAYSFQQYTDETILKKKHDTAVKLAKESRATFLVNVPISDLTRDLIEIYYQSGIEVIVLIQIDFYIQFPSGMELPLNKSLDLPYGFIYGNNVKDKFPILYDWYLDQHINKMLLGEEPYFEAS